VLTDDSGGSALFTTGTTGTGQVSAKNLKPGQSVQNCIKVSYSGSLASAVKLYATSLVDNAPGGTGMAAYLHVLIEEGTAGTFGCSGFAGPSTLWSGSTHPGVASDLLNVFPASYATGPTSGLASWTPGSFRTYRFTFTLDSATPDTSQNASCTVTFNWQAQNT
jgi:hypothetical protein